MKLSIVATLYRSEPYIEEFCRRASCTAQALVGEDYEIVLVNDGSPDRSLEMAVSLAEEDEHLLVVDLSRNFGHHKAMLTGLSFATGERIFLIDSDLEEEPEWAGEFSQKMDEGNFDVVFGVQRKRKGDWFERFSGWAFYKLFNWLTGLDLPKNPVTARLMTHQFVRSLLLHEEREISIGGLFLITGFRQCPVTIEKHSTSDSTYSLSHKAAVFVNSITSFSSKPLVGIFYIGFFIFLLAGVSVTYLIIARLFLAVPLQGWTSLMASIWLIGGMVVMFIGIVGIYLSKVFTETKRRPTSIIRRTYGKKDQLGGDQAKLNEAKATSG